MCIKFDGVHDLEVVNVDANGEDLAADARELEDARVGIVERLEALGAQPVEELALEAAAGLLDAAYKEPVSYWFVHACDHGLAVLIVLGVAVCRVAVHNFTVKEIALQVGGNEVDAAYTAACLGREGEE